MKAMMDLTVKSATSPAPAMSPVDVKPSSSPIGSPELSPPQASAFHPPMSTFKSVFYTPPPPMDSFCSTPVVSRANMSPSESQTRQTSSRILLDIPCKVCQDFSSGKHYGIFACDGCAGFFKRSIRRSRRYMCKAKEEGKCLVDKTHRNQCRACRLTRCLEVGMNKEAVQHERGPRNSTIRRKMENLLRENGSPLSSLVAPPSPPNSNGGSSPSPPATTPLDPTPSISPPLKGPFGYPFFGLTPPTPTNSPFPSFAPPPFLPPAIHPDATCEFVTRLLFLAVKGAKLSPFLSALKAGDQLLLIEDTWKELLLLNYAQFLLPSELGHLLLLAGIGSGAELTPDVISELKVLSEAIGQLRALGVDHTEYSCLKSIVLFKSGIKSSSPGTEQAQLKDPGFVQTLRDQSLMGLSKYVNSVYPTEPMRFGKLLLALPALRSVQTSTLEKLFFKRTIGQASLHNLVLDMYKNPDF